MTFFFGFKKIVEVFLLTLTQKLLLGGLYTCRKHALEKYGRGLHEKSKNLFRCAIAAFNEIKINYYIFTNILS